MNSKLTLACRTGALLFALAGSVRAGMPSAGADWPQWRGPTRDAIAPESPKLSDAWPKEGPKLLWKAEPISGEADGGPVGNKGQLGGCGSITVAGGRAFFFANCKYKKDKVVFSTQALKDLGWVEGLTEDLAKKIDKAYNFSLKGAAQDAHIKEFIATLDPADAQKFGDLVRNNLATNWEDRYSCDLLVRLSKMRDQEFASVEDWARKSPGDILHPHGAHAGEIRNLLNAKGSRYTDTVICLAAGTGEEVWRKEFEGSAGADAHNFSYGASSTPTISEGKCYVAGSAGLYCLAVKDGGVVWQATCKFSNSSPLVHNGAVFITTLDGLLAFKSESGQPLWSQPEVRNTSSSAIVWASGGKDYLLCNSLPRKGSNSSELVCVEPTQGAVLWRAHCGGGACYSTPAISGDMAVVYGYGGLFAYNLTPQKAAIAWQGKGFGGDRGSSPLIYQDHIYTVGGAYDKPSARCLSLRSGEVKWELKLDHTEVSSPVLADGKIFAIVEGYGEKNPSRVIMYKATPEKFEGLATTPRTGDTLCLSCSPSIAGGKLYLRLRNTTACYELTAAAYGGQDLAAGGDIPESVTALKSSAVEAPQTKPADLRIALPRPAAAGETPALRPEDPPDWSKNWPRFRGPSGSGATAADADPPIKFDLAKDVLFRVDVPAKGHSSPIVWGERIFLTGEGDRVMAFDRASGKLLWNIALKAPVPASIPDDEKFKPLTKDTGMAAPTPCTDGKRVYAFFGSGVLGCTDCDGQQLWTTRLVLGKPRSSYGLASSPVLYGNLVIQVVDLGMAPKDNLSFIVAVRTRDGIAAWGQERPVRSAWSTPLLHRGPNGDELVTTASPLVIAYQPQTGMELWRAGTLSGDVAACPVASNNLIYAAAGQGGSELLALKPGGRGDVSKSAIAWSGEAPVPDASSPVCDGKRYF
ncbi:MAG: PQQ-binding-like beta-propeller repeat protein [Planctomycetota bacterium]|nr:PQQ-binding-like beta-propeller repeat protein [Planctomycetota bacterium]